MFRLFLGIQSDVAIALANVKDVKTLEVKGALVEIEVLIRACDNQMNYAITGQSFATAEAQFSTRAQAEVHQEIFDEYITKDLLEPEETLTFTLMK